MLINAQMVLGALAAVFGGLAIGSQKHAGAWFLDFLVPGVLLTLSFFGDKIVAWWDRVISYPEEED